MTKDKDGREDRNTCMEWLHGFAGKQESTWFKTWMIKQDGEKWAPALTGMVTVWSDLIYAHMTRMNIICEMTVLYFFAYRFSRKAWRPLWTYDCSLSITSDKRSIKCRKARWTCRPWWSLQTWQTWLSLKVNQWINISITPLSLIFYKETMKKKGQGYLKLSDIKW